MNTTPTTDTLTERHDGQPAEDRDHFFAQLDKAFGALEAQTLVPQTRCVDHLLDLWNATRNGVLRSVVAAAIDDIRRVTAVLRDDMHAALSVVAVAAEVEL
jgi:hypothetical protein